MIVVDESSPMPEEKTWTLAKLAKVTTEQREMAKRLERIETAVNLINEVLDDLVVAQGALRSKVGTLGVELVKTNQEITNHMTKHNTEGLSWERR